MSQGEDVTLPDASGAAQVRSLPAPRLDLGDRYELGETLGKGGMGEVKLARDGRIHRDGAVKLMRGSQRDEVTVGRFFREARVQGVLEHPAVVPVHDLGIDGDGNPYFVMKRLAGTTLADVIATTEDEVRARWPRRQLLQRLVDICLAIEFAHTRGVVHRDLKPANIMLGDFGEAYVLDWGLARVDDSADAITNIQSVSGDSGHTAAGDLLGTPGYMSPEQARGERVGPATDVYALGCVLYEILVGKPAMPRGMAGIAAAISGRAHRPAEAATYVPPELDDLCALATDETVTRRPSARELAQGIQAYLDGDRDTARRQELSMSLARRASEAVSGAITDDARAAAMRDAGRALALDPDNALAQRVLARLMLDVPAELPAEALAAADDERARTRQDVMKSAGVGFLAMIPVACILFAFPLKVLWPVLALIGLAAAIGLAMLSLARSPIPTETPVFVVLMVATLVLLTLLGIVVGPLLLLPMFLVGSLAGWLQQPSNHPSWILVVAHVVPMVGLVGLELAGVLPSTFAVENGAFVLRSWVIDMTPTIAALTLVLGFAAQVAHIAVVTVSGRRAREAAQDQQHAHAWHLRQLLPRATDDEPKP